MGDMDEWDCFKCGAYCSYRPSNLCRTCENDRLLFSNSMKQWLEDNHIPWDTRSAYEQSWKVKGNLTIVGKPNSKFWGMNFKDGEVLVTFSPEAPLPGEDIAEIVARLNYHDPEFFTQLKKAIE